MVFLVIPGRLVKPLDLGIPVYLVTLDLAVYQATLVYLVILDSVVYLAIAVYQAIVVYQATLVLPRRPRT